MEWCRSRFVVDRRAASLTRVALALYALGDLAARLLMPGSLYWYTGNDVEPRSVFEVTDSPHGAPLHQLLFFRGTWGFQASVFAVHIIFAVVHLLGVRPGLSGPLLWLATVCMHGRQEAFHDGSDKYFRNLLLLSCFIDTRKLQLAQQQKTTADTDEKARASHQQVNNLLASTSPNSKTSCCGGGNGLAHINVGVVGYLLQIMLMYAGVIALRLREGPSWLDGSAVSVALHGSFATRDFPLRHYPVVCEWLTYGAFLGEAMVPALMLLVPSTFEAGRIAIILAVWAVHAGIFTLFYLPQWCIIASLAPLILTPACVLTWVDAHHPTLAALIWGHVSSGQHAEATKEHATDTVNSCATAPSNSLSYPTGSCTEARPSAALRQRSRAASAPGAPQSDAKTKGADAIKDGRGEKTATSSATSTSRRDYLPLLWRVVGALLVAYMVHEWMSTDGKLITSLDKGDVGQGLRFYQGWVMFTQPSLYGGHWFTVHAYAPALARDQNGDLTRIMVDVNVLDSLRDGHLALTSVSEIETRAATIPNCTTCLYPSWRYERFLDQQPNAGALFSRHRIWPLSRHWCHEMRSALSRTLPSRRSDGQWDDARTGITVRVAATESHGPLSFDAIDVDFSLLEIHTIVSGYHIRQDRKNNNDEAQKKGSMGYSRVQTARRKVDVVIRCATWQEFEVEARQWSQDTEEPKPS